MSMSVCMPLNKELKCVLVFVCVSVCVCEYVLPNVLVVVCVCICVYVCVFVCVCKCVWLLCVQERLMPERGTLFVMSYGESLK